jgi:hypothetical protein
VAPNGRRVAAFHPTDDSLSILEPLLIVSLVYAPTGQGAVPSSGNGT